MPRTLPLLPRWNALNAAIINCNLCPRLRAHCLETARVKRAAFATQTYWGKPIPNLAPRDPATAKLLIVGLAPAAHGANRTGRMFTGDRSGDFLFRAMHEAGLASQPTSLHAADGLELIDCAISATCHCAPPDNKPLPDEVMNCQPFLDQTLALLPNLRGVLALGKIGWDASVRLFERNAWSLGKGALGRFAHGAVLYSQPNANMPSRFLLGCYHPSQQNTFTGKLTPQMMRELFETARRLMTASAQPTVPRAV